MGSPAAVRFYRDALIVGTTNAVNQAVRHALGQLPQAVESLGQAIKTDAIPRGKLLEANLQIAGRAQEAVVAGWRSRLPRKSPSGGSASRLTGVLGPALRSPAMLAGTSSRVISFINTDVLNQEAKHWYRVNYGAMGPNLAGGEPPQTHVVTLDGRPFLALRDDNPPAATSFRPKAFFWNGPTLLPTRGPAVPGKGSRAAHFIDIGLEVVAREFPRAYGELFQQLAKDESVKTVERLARKNVVVNAEVLLTKSSFAVEVH